MSQITSHTGMKVRAYLALMVLAILAPIIISSILALKMLHDAGKSSALRNLQETARAVALAVDGELLAAETALTLLTSSSSLAAGDWGTFYQESKVASQHPDTWISVTDDKGRRVVSTAHPFVKPSIQPDYATQREASVLHERATMVSGVRVDESSGEMTVTVSVVDSSPNGRRYVISKTFKVNYFSRLVMHPDIASPGTVGLIDQGGRFIARKLAPQQWVGKPARPELTEAASRSHEGQLRHHTVEGTEVYDVFTHVQRAPWVVAVAIPVDAIDRSAARASLIASVGFLAACLCAAVFALLFASRLNRSINRGVRAATLLRKGEVPQAAHAGVAEMNELHQALQDAGTVLVCEREARLAAEQELHALLHKEADARKRAEEDNKSKDVFLAMLAHELRNPLSAITAGIAIMKMAGLGSQASERAYTIINRQTAHLGRIVDDLLETARMLSGKIRLKNQRIDLAESVRSCLQALEAAGRTSGHVVNLVLEPAPTPIYGDPVRIDQIINNLLVNALKYTPMGGNVDITVKVEDRWAVLEVCDNGIGLAPDMLVRVFEPFVQAEQVLDRSQGGLGIGLTLVRKLAELHGGAVVASSAGEDCGSKFIVRLPLA
jgi:signal transduction histidine kinase